MTLNQDQMAQIKSELTNMNQLINQYLQCEDKITILEKELNTIQLEYSKLTEEDKILDVVMDVLYNQEKKSSISKIKEDEMDKILTNISMLKNDCSKIKSSIIFKMKDFPFPINIENVKYEGSDAILSYFDELQLNETMLRVMTKIIEKEYPLSIDNVIFYDKKVVVKNRHDRKLAIEDIVEAVKNYRLYVDNISKSYERIDGMLERVIQSSNYEGILLTLYNFDQLSAEKIGEFLNLEGRKAYDSCYNLTRDNWSPNPIRKLNSNNWQLTITGKILVERLIEKHPEKYKQFIEKVEGHKNGFG